MINIFSGIPTRWWRRRLLLRIDIRNRDLGPFYVYAV
jgi:hypothetical protein